MLQSAKLLAAFLVGAAQPVLSGRHVNVQLKKDDELQGKICITLYYLPVQD